MVLSISTATIVPTATPFLSTTLPWRWSTLSNHIPMSGAAWHGPAFAHDSTVAPKEEKVMPLSLVNEKRQLSRVAPLALVSQLFMPWPKQVPILRFGTIVTRLLHPRPKVSRKSIG